MVAILVAGKRRVFGSGRAVFGGGVENRAWGVFMGFENSFLELGLYLI